MKTLDRARAEAPAHALSPAGYPLSRRDAHGVALRKGGAIAKPPRSGAARRGWAAACRVLGAAILVGTGACEGGDEKPRVPSKLEQQAGSDQQGLVGAALPVAVSVRVLDERGRAVRGAVVQFAAPSHGGSVAPASDTTGKDGVAQSVWTLGTAAGPQTMSASAAGLSPVEFTARAVAGPPAEVGKSGDAQAASVGSALPAPLAVAVKDRFGNPVPGLAVAWTSDAGTVTPAAAATDAEGIARATWTLGTAARTQNATATAPGISPVAFTAAASPRAATRLHTAGDAQTGTVGTALAAPLAVRATDEFDNPVAGVQVTWAGYGTITPGSAVTGADGTATASWALGTRAGTQEATATIPGAAARFTATANPGPLARLAKAGGDAQTVGPDSDTVCPARFTLATAPGVRALDTYGNPIGGVAVGWTASAGSASPESRNTDAAGVASTVWTVPNKPGEYTLVASAGGLSASFRATVRDGIPTQLHAISGTSQTGRAGETLPILLRARITDVCGTPIAGVALNWYTNSGTVTPVQAVSSATGELSGSWTLGSGTGRVMAALDLHFGAFGGTSVLFHADITP